MATTTSQTPMLYKDWLEQQKALNQQDFDKAVATAGTTLAENKAAVDYNYDRSVTGYGMLAEQLAQSGLSGSGYSDNLTRDAYAARQTGYSDAYKIYGDTLKYAQDQKTAADRTLDLDAYEHNKKMRENFLADIEMVDYGTSKTTLRNLIAAGEYTRDMANDLFDKAGLTRLTEAEYNAIFGMEGGDGTPIKQTAVSPVFRSYYDVLQANAAEGENKITPEFLQALFAAVEASGTAYDKQKLVEILEGPAMQGGMRIGNYNSLAEYLTNTIGAGTVIGAFIDKTRNELISSGNTGTNGAGAPPILPDDLKQTATDDIIRVLREYPGRTYTVEGEVTEDSEKTKAKALHSRLVNLLLDGYEKDGTYYALDDTTATEIENLLTTEFANGETYAEYLSRHGYRVPFVDKEYNAELKADFDKAIGEQENANTPGSTPNTGSVAFNLTSNGFSIGKEPRKLKDGKNFTIEYNGNTYRAELGKQISLTESSNKGIADAAKDAAEGTLFYYNGGIYVKLNGSSGEPEVWTVTKRSMFYADSFNNLTSAIKKNIGDAASKQVTYTFNTQDVINGNGFKITDSLGNTYGVKSAGEVTDPNVLSAAESAKDGTPFVYGDTAYIRIDHKTVDRTTQIKAYRLTDQAIDGAATWKSSYEDLVKNLKDSSTASQLQASQSAVENASKSVSVISTGDNVKGTWDIMFGGIIGNNIKVKIDGTEYAVQVGDQAGDDVVQAAIGANVPEKSVFSYDGQLYLRDKEKYYNLEERKNTGEGGYAKGYDAVFDKEGVQGDSYGNTFELTKVRDGDKFLKLGKQDVADDFGEDDLINYKDEDGKVHRVKIEGEATDVSIPSGVNDGELFAKDGEVYVVKNSKVYKVKRRVAYGNAYKSLLAKLESTKDK